MVIVGLVKVKDHAILRLGPRRVEAASASASIIGHYRPFPCLLHIGKSATSGDFRRKSPAIGECRRQSATIYLTGAEKSALLGFHIYTAVKAINKTWVAKS